MDVEIWFDCQEVNPVDKQAAFKKFHDWYNEGSEVRHNKMSFGSLTALDGDNRYLVDFGYVDVIPAIRNLHARVRHLGVKVFVHFIY